jgi:hypothetical protein
VRRIAVEKAPAVIANLPPADTSPIIVQPPPDVIEAIRRARQQAEQRDVVTVTDDPVKFEEIVELWARENKVPDRTKRLYLSKTTRFVVRRDAAEGISGDPARSLLDSRYRSPLMMRHYAKRHKNSSVKRI